MFKGTIEEPLHPNQARLLDYLNKTDESFVKLHVDDSTILINKSYIMDIFNYSCLPIISFSNK